MSNDAEIGKLVRQVKAEKAQLECYEERRRIAVRTLRQASADLESVSRWREFDYPSACEINHLMRAITSTREVIADCEKRVNALAG